MAKIVNSTFGELSGKLGGMVFSRNAGGAYVRAGVKGTNPQTQSQLSARNAFASVSTLFRSLSSAEKTQWQEFADNWYSPRSGGNTGQFSAYNAFISLRSTVRQALRLAFNPDILLNGTTATGGETFTEFTPMPETPLALGLSAGLATADASSIALDVETAVVTVDGRFRINLRVGDGLGSDVIGNEDVYGNKLGYAVYISNGNPSDNMSYGNEFSKCLGFARPFSLTTPGTQFDGLTDMSIINDTPRIIGQFKRFPLLNEYVNVTVLAMNKYGMFTRLGSIETQIVASLP